MREWAISKTYKIMDYIFAIGVAKDNPHVLGIFASPINTWKMSLIYEFSYKEESEIDSFATEVFPTVVRNYIVRKKLSSSCGEKYIDKEILKHYFYKTLQSLEI